MLVTAIHKKMNISSLEQGTTQHASISISQPPPTVIITQLGMSLIEVVGDMAKGQSNTEKRAHQGAQKGKFSEF